MDPVSISALTSTVLKSLATDAAKTGAKGLLARLKPDDREKTAKRALELFTEEFLKELEDKYPKFLRPGFEDQLKSFLESAGGEIASWLQPETKDVDLAPVARMWHGMGVASLPDFDWPLVAQNYARAIRKHVKSDPALREILNIALAEQQTADIARLAGPDPGFDLPGYRKFLCEKCGVLQLGAMHTSTYDRRIQLWSVFVPQSARESAPIRDIPRELLRRLREEGQVKGEHDDARLALLRESFRSSPITPILDILERDRLVIVLGDPGSGKTSLLKFLVMRWAEHPSPAKLPLWIDLKEYIQVRGGLLKYYETGCATFGLNALEVEKKLKTGEAALYLDGLDEIFDGPTRGSIIEEIAAFAAHYPQTQVIVTSRIVGYEPERLRNAGFTHATLEDFDDAQILEFLRKWHATAEEEPAQRARLETQLTKALKDSRAVRELAGNPLLLTMMAILNRNQPLPRDRVELYAQASRVLLHEWDASRFLPVDAFGRQEKEELLRELAGLMQQAEGGLAGNLIERSSLLHLFREFLKNRGLSDFFNKANHLVEQLEKRNFILCFAGADRFSFVHRTFLEYFCAAWFVDRFQRKQTLTIEQLTNDIFGQHWKDETWHEVLRLIAGMVGEKQAEKLIRYLMGQKGFNHRWTNLTLATSCLNEVRNRTAIKVVDQELRSALETKVIRYRHCRGRETEPSGHNDDERTFEIGVDVRQKAVSLLAMVWPSEETHEWLKRAVITDSDNFVRMQAVEELARGWHNDPTTTSLLKTILESENNVSDVIEPGGWVLQCVAARSIAHMWPENSDILTLCKRLSRTSQNDLVRMIILQELACRRKDDPEVIPLLKDRAISEPNGTVRWAIIDELQRYWPNDPEVIALLEARRNKQANA